MKRYVVSGIAAIAIVLAAMAGFDNGVEAQAYEGSIGGSSQTIPVVLLPQERPTSDQDGVTVAQQPTVEAPVAADPEDRPRQPQATKASVNESGPERRPAPEGSITDHAVEIR